jgi:asparagine synthase (glutamine-hydrolysing)
MKDFALLPKALWHTEDPLVAGIEVARLLLAKATARHVKVVFSGEGADEVLGGYTWYAADKILRPFAQYPYALRNVAAATIAGRWPGAASILLSPAAMRGERYASLIGGTIFADVKQRLFQREYAGAWARRHENDFLPEAFSRWHPMEQLQYHDLTKRLPDAINQQLDRSAMSHSVEVRVPFLDHTLVEFCSQIPASIKLRGLREKYILRMAMRKDLPAEICWRKKCAFCTPTVQWLRDDLPDFARELLSERALKAKGYFNPATVAGVLAQHRARRGNFANMLMAILGVQLWDDMFIRGKYNVV